MKSTSWTTTILKNEYKADPGQAAVQVTLEDGILQEVKLAISGADGEIVLTPGDVPDVKESLRSLMRAIIETLTELDRRSQGGNK